jgi:hypothetical protein
MSTRSLSSIFRHQTTHDRAILKLLENTTIGTNGARYRHLHTSEKISDLYKPHFFTIYRKEHAIANITFCERPMMVNNQLTNTFYIRYFAFDKVFQTNSRAQKKAKSSIFQEYVTALLTTSNLNVDEPKYDPKIFWAIIDPENNRSLQMGERYGFETVASIKTMAFSRIWLKNNQNVYRAKTTEYENIKAAIHRFYTNYSDVTDVHLFEHNNYFVLKENNKIVAGVQANYAEWRIEALPGVFGSLLVKALPYIPLIRRIINPNKYQFLACEGLFWEPGYENRLQSLFEGVLSLQKCHSMLLWIDSKDKRLQKALIQTKLGLLQKVKADNDVNLVAKFNNISPETKAALYQQNHYVSGFDCT